MYEIHSVRHGLFRVNNPIYIPVTGISRERNYMFELHTSAAQRYEVSCKSFYPALMATLFLVMLTTTTTMMMMMMT
jgi:hypothetical protein